MNYKAVTKNNGMYIIILPAEENLIEFNTEEYESRSWIDFCKHMNDQKIFGTNNNYNFDPDFDFKDKKIEITTRVVGNVGQKVYYLKINNKHAEPIMWNASIENELPLLTMKVLEMIKNNKL